MGQARWAARSIALCLLAAAWTACEGSGFDGVPFGYSNPVRGGVQLGGRRDSQGNTSNSPSRDGTSNPTPPRSFTPPAPGTRDSEYPHVVWGTDGKRRPEAGYTWLNDLPGDFRVIGLPGTPYDGAQNVVWAEGGKFRPAEGFVWVTKRESDLRAVRLGSPYEGHPHVVWAGHGQVKADAGYQWLDKERRGDYRVIGLPGTPHDQHPHVVWAEQGRLHPAAGYTWKKPNDPNNLEVIGLPGTSYDGLANVVWAEDGRIAPRHGFLWSTDPPATGGFQVRPDPNFPIEFSRP